MHDSTELKVDIHLLFELCPVPCDRLVIWSRSALAGFAAGSASSSRSHSHLPMSLSLLLLVLVAVESSREHPSESAIPNHSTGLRRFRPFTFQAAFHHLPLFALRLSTPCCEPLSNHPPSALSISPNPSCKHRTSQHDASQMIRFGSALSPCCLRTNQHRPNQPKYCVPGYFHEFQ